MAPMLLVHPAMAADIVLAVATAKVGHDPFSAEPSVEVTLTPEASKAFGKVTIEHIGEVIQLWVDGELVSSPVVQSPILEGSLTISGAMTAADARLLAARLSEEGAVVTLRPAAR
jgi:preprotein translocase subunit SecD